MKRSQYIEYQKKAASVVRRVFPFIKPWQIEIAGFGLEDPHQILALINLFNEPRVYGGGFCGKLLICLPAKAGQRGPECPMHHHLGRSAKKDEGFFVVWGTLIIRLADGTERKLKAGQTAFLRAGTEHALRAKDKAGTVFFEFSDADRRVDVFENKAITRDPDIEEDVPDYKPPEVCRFGFPILGSIGLRLNPQ